MKSRKQKRAIEESNAKQKELEKRLSILRGQLTKTEKKLTKATERTERWKTEANAQRKLPSINALCTTAIRPPSGFSISMVSRMCMTLF